MLRNYFNIALRTLIRNKVFSFINIFGMAIGLASCLIIALFVSNELRYDKYHTRHERIFRVASDLKAPNSTSVLAVTPAPWAPLLESEFPLIQKSVRILRDNRSLVGLRDAQRFYENNVFFSDPAIFSVFDFPLIKGNAEKALTEPNTAVITSSFARKYFGDEDPMGKTLQIATNYGPEFTLTITGVSNDVPEESHFHYNVLLSMPTLGDISNLWSYHMFHTYLLLRTPESANQLGEMLPAFAEKYVNHNADADGEVNIFLQPLSDIHLRSNLVGEIESNSDITYVFMLSGVAVFILILACFNFMNLSTAHSLSRGKEVGLRKTVGAKQGQLISQFLGEAILLTLMAAFVAVLIAYIVLPPFNSIAQRNLTLSTLVNPDTMAMAACFLLFIAFVTGIYRP